MRKAIIPLAQVVVGGGTKEYTDDILMNQVETIRLHPTDPAQPIAWLERFNAAANWLSGVAFRERLWHWLPLQRRAYREVRERFQLPAAATVVVIRKVAYVYRNKKRRQHQATFRRRKRSEEHTSELQSLAYL